MPVSVNSSSSNSHVDRGDNCTDNVNPVDRRVSSRSTGISRSSGRSKSLDGSSIQPLHGRPLRSSMPSILCSWIDWAFGLHEPATIAEALYVMQEGEGSLKKGGLADMLKQSATTQCNRCMKVWNHIKSGAINTKERALHALRHMTAKQLICACVKAMVCFIGAVVGVFVVLPIVLMIALVLLSVFFVVAGFRAIKGTGPIPSVLVKKQSTDKVRISKIKAMLKDCALSMSQLLSLFDPKGPAQSNKKKVEIFPVDSEHVVVRVNRDSSLALVAKSVLSLASSIS